MIMLVMLVVINKYSERNIYFEFTVPDNGAIEEREEGMYKLYKIIGIIMTP